MIDTILDLFHVLRALFSPHICTRPSFSCPLTVGSIQFKFVSQDSTARNADFVRLESSCRCTHYCDRRVPTEKTLRSAMLRKTLTETYAGKPTSVLLNTTEKGTCMMTSPHSMNWCIALCDLSKTAAPGIDQYWTRTKALQRQAATEDAVAEVVSMVVALARKGRRKLKNGSVKELVR